MARPVSGIRNLGPSSNESYDKAGIHSEEELRRLGPDQAYFRVLQAGTRPHFVAYYAMVMGLQGRPWNDCHGPEKAQLRKRFDAIKARLSPNEKGRSEIETALDALGVVKR
ncbi:MAG: TfoX/Sxy family DNA transformation protein [Pseudomonadota bacterium]